MSAEPRLRTRPFRGNVVPDPIRAVDRHHHHVSVYHPQKHSRAAKQLRQLLLTFVIENPARTRENLLSHSMRFHGNIPASGTQMQATKLVFLALQ